MFLFVDAPSNCIANDGGKFWCYWNAVLIMTTKHSQV